MKRSEPRIFHYTIAELYNLIQQDQLIKPATEHVRLEAIPPWRSDAWAKRGPTRTRSRKDRVSRPAAERAYTDPLLSLCARVRDLGYFEGNNIVFEYRFAEDKYNTADLCEAKAMLEELS